MRFRIARSPLPAALLFAACLTACSDCARDGCDNLQTRAVEQGPAVAGIVAQQSDVSVNGCLECPLADADVAVWKTDSEVSTDSAALDVIQTADPFATQAASHRFSLPLAPGRYLLCVRPNCVNIQVGATTVTANVKRRNGPTSFFLAQDASQTPTEQFGLNAGF